jgi:hypothetical protein
VATATTTDPADYTAITRLQALYGDVVTRQAWDELIPMFLPDCPVRLDLRRGTVIECIGPEAIGALIAGSIERFEFFAFTLLNTVVEIRPDEKHASARLYIRELRQTREDHHWTTAYGLYRDTYRKIEGAWKFATRDYTSIARSADSGDGMDVFEIPGR